MNLLDRQTGIVRWYQPLLGYGFIAVYPALKRALKLAADQDLYVHAQGLPGKAKELQPDDVVSFNLEQTAKGWRAVRVLIEAAAPRPACHPD